ncbi:hypothetical protein L914_00996 [Phytophthora nicotianae]|uniref:Ubiquitin-like protease family profile domain-containing protein n=1 Tax=Phytophthora nicotianae TaxID=4792 RepID=W2P7D2_PHYNI|nr:hypothetical protein L914_00996 [Phytophthora nicotianae]
MVDYGFKFKTPTARTISSLPAKLFGPRSNVMIVDPGLIGSIENNDSLINTSVFPEGFAGATKEKILIPVCCSKKRWCCIMLDLETTDICIYDPMGSSYIIRVRALAEKLATCLPDYTPRKYRVQPYQSDLGVQVDSYNCGVYVLVAFELFAGAAGLP